MLLVPLITELDKLTPPRWVAVLLAVLAITAACGGSNESGELTIESGASPIVAEADPVDPNDAPATPTATPEPPVAPVVGTWTVTAIDGNQISSGSESTLVFDEAGEVTGNASCNPFSSTYTTAGDKITFGDITMGVNLCDAAVNQQETSVLTVLNDVTAHSADDATIMLTTSTGATITAVRTGAATVHDTSALAGPYVVVYSASVLPGHHTVTLRLRPQDSPTGLLFIEGTIVDSNHVAIDPEVAVSCDEPVFCGLSENGLAHAFALSPDGIAGPVNVFRLEIPKEHRLEADVASSTISQLLDPDYTFEDYPDLD